MTGRPSLDDDALDAWRAFLTAHAHVTRAIGGELAAEGLPDLSWYDLLWALYRSPGAPEPPRALGMVSGRSMVPSSLLTCPSRPPREVAVAVYKTLMLMTPAFLCRD